jgi:hypothetical protein
VRQNVDAQHQAEATHVTEERVLGGQRVEPAPQPRADRPHVSQHIIAGRTPA